MIITLKNDNSIVKIENGELVNFTINNEEYIHQKGSEGWRKSDDEMFPVIGPTSKNNYKIHTKNGDGIQDQHGLLRELDYEFINKTGNSASLIKNYTKGKKIKNSKYPNKSSEEYLFWPYNFTFKKNYTLKNNLLKIDFIINSEEDMPFMLGYHPAFLLSNTGEETFVANSNIYNLNNVFKAGSDAFPILNTNEIILKNINKSDLKISTDNFNNFMLWTEVNNMVCIEPITHYTSYSNQVYSEKNMFLSKGENKFGVKIEIF